MCSHEQFISAIRQVALQSPALDLVERFRLANAKLCYGRGSVNLRGVTQFQAWKKANKPECEAVDLAEICALGESDFVQLAGTTLHELGHILAGWGAGHGPEWKAACRKLGLRFVRAAGTNYTYGVFDQSTRFAIDSMPKPTDGLPNGASQLPWTFRGVRPTTTAKPCSHGVGSRGGKSRGVGSGSRLRKFTCECNPPLIIRASRDEANCRCIVCGELYSLNVKEED